MRLFVITAFLNKVFYLRMRLYLIDAFLNHSVLFKNVALPNSRILKTFFTLTLKHATYAFILVFFLALRFLSVSALVLPLFFCDPSLSSLCHCKFVSSSLCSLPLVYIFFFRFSYLFVFLLERHHCFIFFNVINLFTFYLL